MNYMTFRLGQLMIKKIFIGRNRSKNQPEKGRFNAVDFNAITRTTWKNYRRLLPDAPEFQTRGNRKMMDAGVLSLAMYRALVNTVGDREYATQLAGDILWKYYAMDLILSNLLSRVLFRDPYKRLNFQLQLGIKHRFGPPEYKVNYHAGPNGFNLDFSQCPICDYFRKQGEEELAFFRKTWCILDFALPDIMAAKGVMQYTRPHTLSAGDTVCDMKFTILPPKNKPA
jgi:hypothetical protein